MDNASPSSELSAVRGRSEAVVAAEAAFDIATAISFWAEDAILQPAGMPQIQGKEGIRELYGQFFESGMIREFSGEASHIAASGDLAYEYGVNSMVLAGDDCDLLDMGKYLLVWRTIEGEWMIVALSFTSDAPEPTPMG